MDDKLEISLIGGITQRDYSPTNDRNFVLAYNMLPVYPVKNEDGTWFDSEAMTKETLLEILPIIVLIIKKVGIF